MTENEHLEKLLNLVADTLNVPKGELSKDSTRDSVEEWDSLSHIILILAIEREFQYKFSIDQIEKINSIADIVDCVSHESHVK